MESDSARQQQSPRREMGPRLLLRQGRNRVLRRLCRYTPPKVEAIYMNDVWVFNVQRMEWEEVQTTGDLPACRSNSSLAYDGVGNQLLLFGGGGSNRNRFNSIHSLDWQTKVWREITPPSTPPSNLDSQQTPWERTYHSGELIYPYLVVFGGESIADLDDLWVFNLQTSEWREVPIPKGATRPSSRRFHSSCVIEN